MRLTKWAVNDFTSKLGSVQSLSEEESAAIKKQIKILKAAILDDTAEELYGLGAEAYLKQIKKLDKLPVTDKETDLTFILEVEHDTLSDQDWEYKTDGFSLTDIADYLYVALKRGGTNLIDHQLLEQFSSQPLGANDESLVGEVRKLIGTYEEGTGNLIHPVNYGVLTDYVCKLFGNPIALQQPTARVRYIESILTSNYVALDLNHVNYLAGLNNEEYLKEQLWKTNLTDTYPTPEEFKDLTKEEIRKAGLIYDLFGHGFEKPADTNTSITKEEFQAAINLNEEIGTYFAPSHSSNTKFVVEKLLEGERPTQDPSDGLFNTNIFG